MDEHLAWTAYLGVFFHQIRQLKLVLFAIIQCVWIYFQLVRVSTDY